MYMNHRLCSSRERRRKEANKGTMQSHHTFSSSFSQVSSHSFGFSSGGKPAALASNEPMKRPETPRANRRKFRRELALNIAVVHSLVSEDSTLTTNLRNLSTKMLWGGVKEGLLPQVEPIKWEPKFRKQLYHRRRKLGQHCRNKSEFSLWFSTA